MKVVVTTTIMLMMLVVFFYRLFTKKQGAAVQSKQQADINIFSVASGHLYERFMSIMIASVMEHTNSTVKFWFIENFLSPTFKDFIPHMAQEYGFDYEMVTYKWPSWLRAQKEKQRTIWGYVDNLFFIQLRLLTHKKPLYYVVTRFFSLMCSSHWIWIRLFSWMRIKLYART